MYCPPSQFHLQKTDTRDNLHSAVDSNQIFYLFQPYTPNGQLPPKHIGTGGLYQILIGLILCLDKNQSALKWY